MELLHQIHAGTIPPRIIEEYARFQRSWQNDPWPQVEASEGRRGTRMETFGGRDPKLGYQGNRRLDSRPQLMAVIIY